MSLPIPLTVRLRTDRASLDVTADVRDLTFGWEDPGGFKSCRIPLDRPLTIQPDEIAYYGQVTVYDRRDGTIVFDGRMEDPGRSARDGQVWDLTAMGGSAHTRDRTLPLIYVDRPRLSGFERVLNNAPGGTNSAGDDPGGSGKDAVILQFPQGLAISNTSRIQVRYGDIARAGQKLGLIGYAWDGGSNDANMLVESIASTNGGAGEIPRTAAINTAGGAYATRVVGTHWTNGRNTLDLRYVRNAGGAYTVPSDLAWASFYDVVVVAMRHLAGGGEKTGGYTDTVLASDVVADLLGRVLTQYDGASATIATTSHAIDQLAYPDGVTPERVLQDLLALEAGHTWRVWERGPAGYRFEFVPLPSQVRYEADVSGGYESQGSSDGLFNRVTVRGRDRLGRVQTVERTSTVPALSAAGLVRQGPIDLGDEVWSAANAARAGDQWLAARQFPPNAGQLRIAGPILDVQTGRMVMPWEIRPGLIRVRGILPRTDALNATSRDGVTVFRIVSSEFRASDGTATLELDSHARTTPRLIAGLIRSMPSSRRR